METRLHYTAELRRPRNFIRRVGTLDFRWGPIVVLFVVGIAVTIFWMGALIWWTGALIWSLLRLLFFVIW